MRLLNKISNNKKQIFTFTGLTLSKNVNDLINYKFLLFALSKRDETPRIKVLKNMVP